MVLVVESFLSSEIYSVYFVQIFVSMATSVGTFDFIVSANQSTSSVN